MVQLAVKSISRAQTTTIVGDWRKKTEKRIHVQWKAELHGNTAKAYRKVSWSRTSINTSKHNVNIKQNVYSNQEDNRTYKHCSKFIIIIIWSSKTSICKHLQAYLSVHLNLSSSLCSYALYDCVTLKRLPINNWTASIYHLYNLATNRDQ